MAKFNHNTAEILQNSLIKYLIYSSRSADSLMAESGCRLDHPVAAKFRQHVMDGDWSKADHDLQELRLLLGNANANLLVSIRKNHVFGVVSKKLLF